MVNSKDLRIPVRMSARVDLRRPKHNVATTAGIDCVAIATDVICSIVHGKLFCRVYGVVDDPNCVPFFISEEAGIVAIETFP